MVFGRRKSSNNVDPAQVQIHDDTEARTPTARNRLSKPLTNKSSTNLNLLLNAQEQETKSNNVSTEALATPMSPQQCDEEKRQYIRAHVFDIDEDNAPSQAETKHKSLTGVASLVTKFESQSVTNTSQQPLLSPTKKAKRPISDFFSSRRSSAQGRPSLISTNSRDRLASLKDRSNTTSPAVSAEQISDGPVYPTSRRASYLPGTATRRSSGTESLVVDNPKNASPPRELPIQEEVDDDSDVLSFDEGDEDEWLPSDHQPRPTTPASLEYAQLGGIRLGSLQVVNGRASPSASVISKHLIQAQIASMRDASSDYGDSEPGEIRRKPVAGSSAAPVSHNREVSWYSRRSSKLHEVETMEAQSADVEYLEKTDRDTASSMAAEYIAELPTSPYAAGRNSPDSSLHETMTDLSDQSAPVERTSKFSRGQPIQVHKRSSPVATRQTVTVYSDMGSVHSFEPASYRSSSPVPSESSSTGSVLRTTTKRTEIDDDLFDDETVGHSTEGDQATIDSFHSWQSPVNLGYQRSEAFESALEFQAHGTSLRTEPPAEPGLLEPPKRFENSDSGYSSSNSVRSSSGERVSRAEDQAAPVAMQLVERTTTAPVAEQRSGAARFFRPILKSRKTAPAVPSFNNLQMTPPSSKSASIAPSVAATSTASASGAESEKSKPKKLQKRGFLKTKKPIIVTSQRSIDDLSIPAISAEAMANLHVRSQAVPELERTFRSEHHIRNQASMASMSTMTVPFKEIRFPSPTPELEPPSNSRRRSWFGKDKEDKPKLPRHSGMNQMDTMTAIKDFGIVASSLGGNPYDIAYSENGSREPSRTRMNPHDISSMVLQPRPYMDDQTAADMARLRSASIRERDNWNQKSSNSRKPSFNDRGGIPGKSLRPASVRSEAPPMPALPMNDDSQHQWTHEQEDERDVAPPPPPHSPQPSFVEGPNYFENETPPPPPSHSPRPMEVIQSPQPSFVEGQDYLDNTPAPPPPSHSPRPVEAIRDPWAAQAAAWKARRQTADYTLKRQSWNGGPYAEQAIEEDSIYPSLPPRRNDTIQRKRLADTQIRHYILQPASQPYDHDEYRHGQQYNHQHNDYANQYQPYSQPRHYQQPYQFLTQSYDNDPSQNTTRALPRPSPRSSRPVSQAGSHRSFASSMAEELHPNLDSKANQGPKNDFGRYSGGLQYGFDRDVGFGGSAGTRTVSGKADAGYKGVNLRQGYGVDLGDVPVMGVVRRVDPVGFR